jgi:hypothetical protein
MQSPTRSHRFTELPGRSPMRLPPHITPCRQQFTCGTDGQGRVDTPEKYKERGKRADQARGIDVVASYAPRLAGAHASVPMATREATDVSRVQHGGRLTAIDPPGHEAVICHTLHRFLFSTKNSFFSKALWCCHVRS